MRILATALAVVTVLTAQDPGPAAEPPVVALVGGRVLVAAGETPRPATVLIEGERIVGVGEAVAVPDHARRVVVDGLVIMPAFIDVASDAFVGEEQRGLQAQTLDERIADLLDAPATGSARRRALAAGVGAVYVDLRNQPASEGGTGALVFPGIETLRVVDPEAGGTFSLGSRDANQGLSLLARRGARGVVRTAFDAADRYRKAWKEYEEKRKKYEQDLAGFEAGGAKASEPAAEGARREGGAEPDPAGRPRPQRDRRRREPGPASNAEARPAAQKPAQRPTPPSEPARDPGHETMLRILDGKARLRIEAHWKEDIRIALELARSRKLPLTLLGATEAHLVADEIRALPVVVVPAAPVTEEGPRRARGEAVPDQAARLARQGIPLAFASLGQAGFGPDGVPLIAALAQAQGLEQEQAFRALTVGAAEALGRGSDFGRVEAGRIALLQCRTEEDPFAPTSAVRVLVQGGEVHDLRTEP
jgi:imidazolonepropionase-like amidohydrolase